MQKENITPQSDSFIEMEEGTKFREAPEFGDAFEEPALPRWRLVTLIFWYVFGKSCEKAL
jgi:hypothetical protein